jgi:hypothetical protein
MPDCNISIFSLVALYCTDVNMPIKLKHKSVHNSRLRVTYWASASDPLKLLKTPSPAQSCCVTPEVLLGIFQLRATDFQL